MTNDWFLNWSLDNDVNIGFFDSATQINSSSAITAPGTGASPNPAAYVAIGSHFLKGFAEMQASEAQVSNIYRNIARTEKNIEQMEEQLFESLDIQTRKISRRHGTQMARVGASGVAFSGSPLMVMAETHRRGMEDYEAIEKRGKYAIDDAYLSIYDQIAQAKDIGKAQKWGAATNLVGAVGSAYRFGVL